MTTNQTIDGVPSELIEKAMLACFEAGFGIPHAELRALLDSQPCAKSQAEPDPMLCNFYEVTDWPGLVRELVGHVAQLQDSAKRNVKPWEDTFPPTLLPAYIERVNAENAATQPQAEQPAPVAVVLPERSNAVASANINHRQAYSLGWNACLDELKRLNAKPTCCGSCPGGCVIQGGAK